MAALANSCHYLTHEGDEFIDGKILHGTNIRIRHNFLKLPLKVTPVVDDVAERMQEVGGQTVSQNALHIFRWQKGSDQLLVTRGQGLK